MSELISGGGELGDKSEKMSAYEADDIFVTTLVSFGFCKRDAQRALNSTGGKSIDQALEWLSLHPLEEKSNLSPPVESQISKKAKVCEKMKMVLVVRQDLKMGMGKVGAQCGFSLMLKSYADTNFTGHAAVGAYAQAMLTDAGLVQKWMQSGSAKIVLKVNQRHFLYSFLVFSLSLLALFLPNQSLHLKG